jgi:4-amino-4-deoxy-L-arabinose transferase-like glycosyltransferase
MATTKPSQLSAPLPVFLAAFVVRVLYLTLAHTYLIHNYDNHMLFGEEMGRVARALATGYGFSDPFRGHTGPTAWVGPLFPLILAGVFKCFGVFTPASAWTILTINSLFSALTASAIWEIGARCFNQSVARWSAWIWVLYPAAMQYAVRWIWDTSLSTCLFTWVLVMALRLHDQPKHGRWILLGLLWALTGLSNPALLIFLPACGVWLLAGTGWKSRLSGAMLGLAVFCICFAPWVWRNWVVFHQFVPARGNFGAELYLGNGPGATGLLMEYDHPIQAPDQLRLYSRMGEIAYSRMRGEQAMAIIDADPALFLRNTLRRIFFFWGGTPHPTSQVWAEYGRSLNFVFGSVCGLMGLGLALWRRKPAAGLFAWAFFLLPLVYYPVAAHARFRHPLEPLMVVLGVYLFQSAER